MPIRLNEKKSKQLATINVLNDYTIVQCYQTVQCHRPLSL